MNFFFNLKKGSDADENFEFASRTIQDNLSGEYYFLMGGKEGESGVPYLEKMIKIVKEKGLPSEQYRVNIIPEGEHNEALWRAQFPEAFKWLYVN